eukprot:m.25143 g.25143  ORF g.25143 m.25143 type:complete len:110 (+) comp5730_c0_seq2:59-388(+)
MTTTANTTVDVVEGTFGTVDGTVVRLFTIKNGSMEVDVITYGGVSRQKEKFSRHTQWIVLDFDTCFFFPASAICWFGLSIPPPPTPLSCLVGWLSRSFPLSVSQMNMDS